MSVYKYKAIDKRGQAGKSTIFASSRSAAASAILAKGLTPLSIDEEVEGSFDLNTLLARIGTVRLREITLFLRMLSALIGSGITIVEAIAVLHEQVLSKKFKWILGEVKVKIEGGVSLSDALADYPRIFPTTAVNMILAGEIGGILEEVLNNLVEYMEKKAALKSMIIRSFIYPSLVLVVATGVVVFLVTFVIPRFMVLLKGAKLPWNTQLLLDVSEFLITNAITIVMGITGTVAVIIICFVIKETRVIIDRYKVYLPIFGPIFRMSVIAQFTRTMASLLNSGISLVEALNTTNNTLTNQAVRQAIDDAVEKVMAGDKLSTAFEGSGVFTSLMVSMIRIGEQSGNMDQSVRLVADIYEKQLEDRINWMSSMVEPVLILGLGGVVGFVAWGLVAGMLSAYSA